MYEVRRSVKGAMRVMRSTYATQAEAEAVAARWRASNSTGQYIAKVTKI